MRMENIAKQDLMLDAYMMILLMLCVIGHNLLIGLILYLQYVRIVQSVINVAMAFSIYVSRSINWMLYNYIKR